MIRRLIEVGCLSSLAFAASCAASSNGDTGGDPTSHGDAGADSRFDASFDVTAEDSTRSDTSSSPADDTSTDPPVDAGPTWGSTCPPGSAPKVSGQVFAPNGHDPAPTSYAYAPISVTPYVPGVACDACDKAIDPFWVQTLTGVDGTFTLDLADVPATPTVKIAVRKGRFRKVVTVTPACGTTTKMPAADTTLPGSTTAGDLPKIAVSTGNSDHLDTILTALGITSFSCYEGRVASGALCPAGVAAGKKVLDLLRDATTLDTFNVLLVSCAPNIWSSYSPTDQATIKTNLAAWVNKGGRFFATDNSYDYVAQTWPDAITWQGPTGTPWPVGTLAGGGANVGVVPASGSYAATVDDPDITSWLKLPEIAVTSAPSVSISGWLKPWSVQKSLAATTTRITHGSVQFQYPSGAATTTSDLPLTAKFVVNSCGKVVYSSYHTLSSVSASGLTPQERILEYLLLDVASCVNGIK